MITVKWMSGMSVGRLQRSEILRSNLTYIYGWVKYSISPEYLEERLNQ